MKLILKLLTLFFLLTAQAHAADVNAICLTSVGKTTTFFLKTEDNIVNFQILNHNGGDYAPFWSSLVVPNDIKTLEKKAEIIKKLDQGFKAKWKPEQCKWNGDKKFICMGTTDKVEVSGLEIAPWAVYSSIATESSFAGDFEYIDMTVSFEIEAESYQYTMRYPSEECVVSESKIPFKNIKGLQ